MTASTRGGVPAGSAFGPDDQGQRVPVPGHAQRARAVAAGDGVALDDLQGRRAARPQQPAAADGLVAGADADAHGAAAARDDADRLDVPPPFAAEGLEPAEQQLLQPGQAAVDDLRPAAGQRERARLRQRSDGARRQIDARRRPAQPRWCAAGGRRPAAPARPCRAGAAATRCARPRAAPRTRAAAASSRVASSGSTDRPQASARASGGATAAAGAPNTRPSSRSSAAASGVKSIDWRPDPDPHGRARAGAPLEKRGEVELLQHAAHVWIVERRQHGGRA